MAENQKTSFTKKFLYFMRHLIPDAQTPNPKLTFYHPLLHLHQFNLDGIFGINNKRFGYLLKSIPPASRVYTLNPISNLSSCQIVKQKTIYLTNLLMSQ